MLGLNVLGSSQVTYSSSHLEKPDFNELTHRWKGYADGSYTNPLYLSNHGSNLKNQRVFSTQRGIPSGFFIWREL